MKPAYSDVEDGHLKARNNNHKILGESSRSSGMSGSGPVLHSDTEEYKKMRSYHEMALVHRLTMRIYFQCLVLLVIIGILLVIFTVQSPFKTLAPMANDLMCIVGVGLFLTLSFFAFTCGSENAQTKLVLIILISIFLGLSSGFFVAMNVSLNPRV